MRAPIISLALCLVFGCTAMAQSTSDATRGQHLFMTDGCYECHGTVGQGGAGPRLAPDPLSADLIAQYIRKPAAVMPPYVEKVVSDQDVRDIQAYLASINRPPLFKDIKLLAP
jgi:ubiquinol-cytochrome c reductase cytochrome c subunit